MAIVLTVGVNTWVTLAEANNYMAEKWGASSVWAAIPDEEKKQLLISAYRWLRRSPDYNLSAVVSTAKQEAQIELAWYMYNYYAEHEDRDALYTQGVREFELSKWREKLKASGLPKIVTDLLDDELQNTGGYFPTVTRDFDENL